MPIYKDKGSKDGKQKYKVRINYQNSYGENKQVTRICYGSAEAKELERQLTYEIKNETPAKKITLNEVFNLYIKSKRPEIREASLNKSITILQFHVLSFLGNKTIDKLSVPILMEWKQHIENKTIDKTQKKLSLTMKQNVYGEFRALLNFAVKMEYLPSNPLLKVGNFKQTLTLEENKEMDFYAYDEFKKFISAAKDVAENSNNLVDWDYYIFFTLAFFTGMRKGEIHALKWSDLEGNILHIRRSIAQKMKGKDVETPPKNRGSIRDIKLPSQLQNSLTKHKERWSEYQGFSEDFRICGGTKPLRDSSLDKRNRKYADIAGVKRIRIHDFRHSHASLLANEGINIQEIARRLGHSDIKLTLNTYSHLYPREEERAIKILENL